MTFEWLPRIASRVCCGLLVVILWGCAGTLEEAQQHYTAGNPERALELLAEKEGKSRRNQLLFHLEQGWILHTLGRYEKSADQLLKAAALLERLDIIRLGEQAGSLVGGEWAASYRGEYSERLWIHTIQIMNFLLLDDYDAAQVEARQALKHLQQQPKVLAADYFSRGLIALTFAQINEKNDAYLVYRKLAEDLHPSAVATDLVQLAGYLGIPANEEDYRPYLPVSAGFEEAELVLFIASGVIPQKRAGNFIVPPSIRFSFPYYAPLRAPAQTYQISPDHYSPLPELTTSLADVAVAALEARRLAMIAKETARVAGKEVLAQAIGRDQGATVEALVRLGLFLMEEPDTRSWRSLPAFLTLLRIPLPAGHHRLQLHGSGIDNRFRHIDLPAVTLRAGQRRFMSLQW